MFLFGVYFFVTTRLVVVFTCESRAGLIREIYLNMIMKMMQRERVQRTMNDRLERQDYN
jgi:hypothetical protein